MRIVECIPPSNESMVTYRSFVLGRGIGLVKYWLGILVWGRGVCVLGDPGRLVVYGVEVVVGPFGGGGKNWRGGGLDLFGMSGLAMWLQSLWLLVFV